MINTYKQSIHLPNNQPPECLKHRKQPSFQQPKTFISDNMQPLPKISSIKPKPFKSCLGLKLPIKLNESIKLDPQELDNKYTLVILPSFSNDLISLYRIGSGASGEVFLVKDKSTNELYAVKTIKYNSEEKMKKLLDSEIQALQKIRHECIVKCYSTYINQGTLNMVLEYMDKGTLAEVLLKVHLIPEAIISIIISHIVKGLDYLQKDMKMIHRDLKPSNILLSSKGIAKISDFGVSAIVDDSWTLRKTMIGTYLYMSPERFNNEGYYLNADIWSLGIIVMECILGFYPYLAKNDFQPFNDIWSLQETIEKSSPFPDWNDFSPELSDFLTQCLIKDEKQRPTAHKLINHPFISKHSIEPNINLRNWLAFLDFE